MTVQHLAYRDSECVECGSDIAQDDPIYWTDEGPTCEDCADEMEIRCPICGGHKKPSYATCYDCED